MAKGDKPGVKATILDAPTLSSFSEVGPEVTTLAPMPVFEDEASNDIGAIVPPAGEFDLERPTDADLGKAIAVSLPDNTEGREDTAKIPPEVVAAARKAADALKAAPAKAPAPSAPSVAAAPADAPPRVKAAPLITETPARARRVVEKKNTPPPALSDSPSTPQGLQPLMPTSAATITRSKIDPQLPRKSIAPAPMAGGPKEAPPLTLPKPESPILPRAPIAPQIIAPAASSRPARKNDGRFRLRLRKKQPGDPLITPVEGGIAAVVILFVSLLIAVGPQQSTLPSIGEGQVVLPSAPKVSAPVVTYPAPGPPAPMLMAPGLSEEKRAAQLQQIEADFWKDHPELRPIPEPM